MCCVLLFVQHVIRLFITSVSLSQMHYYYCVCVLFIHSFFFFHNYFVVIFPMIFFSYTIFFIPLLLFCVYKFCFGCSFGRAGKCFEESIKTLNCFVFVPFFHLVFTSFSALSTFKVCFAFCERCI